MLVQISTTTKTLQLIACNWRSEASLAETPLDALSLLQSYWRIEKARKTYINIIHELSGKKLSVQGKKVSLGGDDDTWLLVENRLVPAAEPELQLGRRGLRNEAASRRRALCELVSSKSKRSLRIDLIQVPSRTLCFKGKYNRIYVVHEKNKYQDLITGRITHSAPDDTLNLDDAKKDALAASLAIWCRRAVIASEASNNNYFALQACHILSQALYCEDTHFLNKELQSISAQCGCIEALAHWLYQQEEEQMPTIAYLTLACIVRDHPENQMRLTKIDKRHLSLDGDPPYITKSIERTALANLKLAACAGFPGAFESLCAAVGNNAQLIDLRSSLISLEELQQYSILYDRTRVLDTLSALTASAVSHCLAMPRGTLYFCTLLKQTDLLPQFKQDESNGHRLLVLLDDKKEWLSVGPSLWTSTKKTQLLASTFRLGSLLCRASAQSRALSTQVISLFANMQDSFWRLLLKCILTDRSAPYQVRAHAAAFMRLGFIDLYFDPLPIPSAIRVVTALPKTNNSQTTLQYDRTLSKENIFLATSLLEALDSITTMTNNDDENNFLLETLRMLLRFVRCGYNADSCDTIRSRVMMRVIEVFKIAETAAAPTEQDNDSSIIKLKRLLEYNAAPVRSQIKLAALDVLLAYSNLISNKRIDLLAASILQASKQGYSLIQKDELSTYAAKLATTRWLSNLDAPVVNKNCNGFTLPQLFDASNQICAAALRLILNRHFAISRTLSHSRKIWLMFGDLAEPVYINHYTKCQQLREVVFFIHKKLRFLNYDIPLECRSESEMYIAHAAQTAIGLLREFENQCRAIHYEGANGNDIIDVQVFDQRNEDLKVVMETTVVSANAEEAMSRWRVHHLLRKLGVHRLFLAAFVTAAATTKTTMSHLDALRKAATDALAAYFEAAGDEHLSFRDRHDDDDVNTIFIPALAAALESSIDDVVDCAAHALRPLIAHVEAHLSREAMERLVDRTLAEGAGASGDTVELLESIPSSKVLRAVVAGLGRYDDDAASKILMNSHLCIMIARGIWCGRCEPCLQTTISRLRREITLSAACNAVTSSTDLEHEYALDALLIALHFVGGASSRVAEGSMGSEDDFDDDSDEDDDDESWENVIARNASDEAQLRRNIYSREEIQSLLKDDDELCSHADDVNLLAYAHKKLLSISNVNADGTAFAIASLEAILRYGLLADIEIPSVDSLPSNLLETPLGCRFAVRIGAIEPSSAKFKENTVNDFDFVFKSDQYSSVGFNRKHDDKVHTYFKNLDMSEKVPGIIIGEGGVKELEEFGKFQSRLNTTISTIRDQETACVADALLAMPVESQPDENADNTGFQRRRSRLRSVSTAVNDPHKMTFDALALRIFEHARWCASETRECNIAGCGNSFLPDMKIGGRYSFTIEAWLQSPPGQLVLDDNHQDSGVRCNTVTDLLRAYRRALENISSTADEPAAQSVERLRDRLIDAGGAVLAVDIILSFYKNQRGAFGAQFLPVAHHTRLAIEATKLSIALLANGTNELAQRRIVKKIRDETDFLKGIASMLDAASLAWRRTSKLSRVVSSHESALKTDFVLDILKFFQLLCENHNSDAQSLLTIGEGHMTILEAASRLASAAAILALASLNRKDRQQQSNEVQSARNESFAVRDAFDDEVRSPRDASSLAKDAADTTLSAIILLIEAMQGPCAKNQECLASGPDSEFLRNSLIGIIKSRESESREITAALRAAAMDCLLAMIECRDGDGHVTGKLRRVVKPRTLRKVIFCHAGRCQLRGPTWLNPHRAIVHSSLVLGLKLARDQKASRAAFRRARVEASSTVRATADRAVALMLERAFYGDEVMNNSSSSSSDDDDESTSQWNSTRQQRRQQQARSQTMRSIILLAFNTCSIEVAMPNGEIVLALFPKPEEAQLLTNEMKRRTLDAVDVTSDDHLAQFLLHAGPTLLDKLGFLADTRKCLYLRIFFETVNFLHPATYSIVVLLTVVLIVQLEYKTPPKARGSRYAKSPQFRDPWGGVLAFTLLLMLVIIDGLSLILRFFTHIELVRRRDARMAKTRRQKKSLCTVNDHNTLLSAPGSDVFLSLWRKTAISMAFGSATHTSVSFLSLWKRTTIVATFSVILLAIIRLSLYEQGLLPPLVFVLIAVVACSLCFLIDLRDCANLWQALHSDTSTRSQRVMGLDIILTVYARVYDALCTEYILVMMIWFMCGLIALSLGVRRVPYLATIQLLDIGRQSETLRDVVRAVGRPLSTGSLVMAGVLCMIVLILFALAAFVHFAADFVDGICNTAASCVAMVSHIGLLSGVGNFLSFDSDESELPTGLWGDDKRRAKRIAFDLFFFLIVTILLLNLVLGIIIDTFSQLRDQSNQRSQTLTNKCFVCGLKLATFDDASRDQQSIHSPWYPWVPSPGGGDRHTHFEHSMWNYLYFVDYIRRKPSTEYDGVEYYVASKLAVGDLSWCPSSEALILRHWTGPGTVSSPQQRGGKAS